MQRARHAHDREAKKKVLKWWKDDKEKGRDKVDMIEEYQDKLSGLGLYPIGNNKSKSEQRQQDEEENYTYETISRWLANK